MDLLKSGMLSLMVIANIPSTTEYIANHNDELTNDIVIELKQIWREEELVDYIKTEANKYGVDTNIALKVMNCEAPWKTDEDGRYYDVNDSQSRIKYSEGQIKRNPGWGVVGEREKSYGIWQYHLPAHKINIEEASSVEISTERAMQDLKTRPSQWSCYKS